MFYLLLWKYHTKKFLQLFFSFSGKTVISKERALRKQKEDPEHQVYFISLLGSTNEGKPEKTRFIFDVLTKWFEFNGERTKVQAVDVQDLQTVYNTWKTMHKFVSQIMGNNNPGPLLKLYEEPLDTYDLAEFFIHLKLEECRSKCRSLNASFIFDEVPFIKKRYEYTIYHSVISEKRYDFSKLIFLLNPQNSYDIYFSANKTIFSVKEELEKHNLMDLHATLLEEDITFDMLWSLTEKETKEIGFTLGQRKRYFEVVPTAKALLKGNILSLLAHVKLISNFHFTIKTYLRSARIFMRINTNLLLDFMRINILSTICSDLLCV